MKKLIAFSLLFISLFSLSSCEKYFGDKTDLDFIDKPQFTNRQVAYVPIQPAITGFVRPTDICVGFDELIYVVDAGTEEVVSMDEAGRIIGRFKVPGARAVAQDRKFDLLVIGRTDTTVQIGSTVDSASFTTIYRVRMLNNNGYGLDHAKIINKIVHPFYFKNSYSASDKTAEFNRIGIIGDNQDPSRNNSYYVTRSGTSTNILHPDDAVLHFDNQDNFLGAVPVSTSSGVFNNYFEEPFGITTLTQPPQLSATSSSDFLYTSRDPNNALKVQYISFVESEFGAEYQPKILASQDTSKASGFINSPDKFEDPVGITIAGDASRYIFVVDKAKDSLYQFTFDGYEGVLPPAASGITKYQKASFGGKGTGLTQFDQPMAVAYFHKIVYVADAGNGRILRFKLTLDFD